MLKRETRLVMPGQGSLSTPVDRSIAAAYAQGERVRYYYQRHGHSVGDITEDLLGKLDGGNALLFPSGMAAVASVFLTYLKSGSRVAISDDAYYGVIRLGEVLDQWGVEFFLFDPMTGDVPDRVDMVWLEVPSSSRLRFPDVRGIATKAHAQGALVAVDATVATPMLYRPIEDGADLTVHSATKMLAGHSDVLMGVVVCRDDEFAATLDTFRIYAGVVAAPDPVWLLLRGLKTLAVRIERQSATALELARRLSEHPTVTAVYYPGIDDELASARMEAFGSLVSFELRGGVGAAQAVEQATNIFVNSTSFGGCESLIESRYRWEQGRMPESLVRISVGLEHVEDLWEDLGEALQLAEKIAVENENKFVP
jgi:cystathionine gamma-synthase